MTLTKELEKILDERHGKKCKVYPNFEHGWHIAKKSESDIMIYHCIVCHAHGPVKIEVLPEA